jgi:hypothetical protein
MEKQDTMLKVAIGIMATMVIILVVSAVASFM